jgi:drug/metabolite transporter (DMT)-like permease
MLWAAVLYTVVMCAHGYSFVTTKKLVNTNAVQISYHLGVIIVFSSAVLMPYALNDGDYNVPSIGELAEAVVVTGLPMTLGQLAAMSSLLITHNYGMLTPFQFSTIIVGYLVSIFRYDEKVNFICALGTVAIVLGVIFIVRCKSPSFK